jgi:hypothetical protein
MTGSNILPQRELRNVAGDPAKRDLLLNSCFGITLEEISRVRSITDLGERIVEAASVLYQHAKLVSPGVESQQLTELTIASLVYKDWTRPDTKGSCIYNYLKRNHQHDINHRLKPSHVHFIRDLVGAYSGNLEKAAELYTHFRASDDDFLKSVTIPLKLSYELNNLLGVFYSCGLIPKSKQNTNLVIEHSEPYVVSINGDISFAFFDTLPERIKESFNMATKVNYYGSGKDGEITVKTKQGPYTHSVSKTFIPRIVLPSKALTTWLSEDLSLFDSNGKPKELSEREAENLFDGELPILAYLGGIADTCGVIRIRNSKYSEPILNCFHLTNAQKNTISLLRNMAGFNTRKNLHATGYIGHNELKEMYDNHFITNPFLLEKLSCFYGSKKD